MLVGRGGLTVSLKHGLLFADEKGLVSLGTQVPSVRAANCKDNPPQEMVAKVHFEQERVLLVKSE